jgi:hypothetical protein
VVAVSGEKDGEREGEKKQRPLVEGLTGTSDEFVGSSTGQRLDEDQCKIATFRDAGLLLGNDRDDDRLRLAKYALNHPEGVLLPQIVRDVFGKRGPVNPGDADYQLARRFYTANSDFFQTFEQNGMTAVESKLPLFDLIAQGITQKSADAAEPQTDRGFCRDLLKTVNSLNSDGEAILQSGIESYVNRINDWRLLFEMTEMRSGRSQLFVEPYKTRFNSMPRIKQQWARYQAALRYAREQFDNGALVTLTTDPKKFPHLLAQIEEINPNFNRLMSWMGYDCKEKETSRPGYRPPYIKFLEFTEKGYPHLHILFFDVPERADGTPWLIDKGECSEKWRDLGQGRIVDIQGLTYRDDLPDRYSSDEGFVSVDEARAIEANEEIDAVSSTDKDSDETVNLHGATAAEYIGKYLSAVFGGTASLALGKDFTAESSVGEKSAAYKIGLYWATNRRIWTCSKDIEEAIEPDEEESEDLPIQIEFIGAYPFWDLPASVVANSRPLAEHIDAVHGSDEPEPSGDDGGDRPPPTPV